MRALLLIATGLAMALVAAGCGSSVQLGVVAIEPAPHYCFVADVKDPRGRRAVGCFDTLKLCWRARETARAYGGPFGVRVVGPCERWALQ